MNKRRRRSVKKISLIVSENRNNEEVRIENALKMVEIFSKRSADLVKRGIDFEIVYVTDESEKERLNNVEVFPKMTDLKLVRERGLRQHSELIISGVEAAENEYIGILRGGEREIEKMIGEALDKIEKGNEVVAALPKGYVSRLPFSVKLRMGQGGTGIFFPKALWDVISFRPQNEKLFMVEFLRRAQEAGFGLRKYFFPNYESIKVRFSKSRMGEFLSSWKDVFGLVLRKTHIYIPADNEKTMVNAGLFYKKQRYITHTTLSAADSAVAMVDFKFLFSLFLVIIGLGIFLVLEPIIFIQYFIFVISFIYLVDACFYLFLIYRSFRGQAEVSFSQRQLREVRDRDLPIYSVLCPMYKEAYILPQFIKGLERLDWPKDKLDVIVLLECDDIESIATFKNMSVPNYMRMLVVPDSIPKTKPKACNYGLGHAKGEFMVIFDAEDIPDPMQLKKAYLGFKTLGPHVKCIQAKLNFYNSNQNLLTRFFTIEYSMWFNLVLTGLAALETVIPLGGTSNHFRTEDLKKIKAWDPFNVTEDADLGLRLFKSGYKTVILDSVTLEEGNSNLGNWIRQRSRWIKGYMQTYFVHTKETIGFFKKRGIHAIIFHMVIGAKIMFILVNPALWIITLFYFGMYWLVGPTIDKIYPPYVLYPAITSLIFGNYLYLFTHIMGCIKNNQWSLIKYVYLIPIYWIIISIAGFAAFYQLIFKPFYWEKTVHGLHLKDNLKII